MFKGLLFVLGGIAIVALLVWANRWYDYSEYKAPSIPEVKQDVDKIIRDYTPEVFIVPDGKGDRTNQ